MFPITLPYSTAGCDIGPITHFRPGSLIVWYDAGSVWTRLQFDACIAMRFTPDPSVTEAMVGAYSRVDEVTESSWISDLQTEARGKLLPSIRHMMIYFDHRGCIEALASGISIHEKAVPPLNQNENGA